MIQSIAVLLAFALLLARLPARLLPLALSLPLAMVSVLASPRLPGVRGGGAQRHHMPFLVFPLAKRHDLTKAGAQPLALELALLAFAEATSHRATAGDQAGAPLAVPT